MTKEQKTEVRDYLLAKKLPIDVMIEVEDHFLSQINELQIEKDLTFYDAFNVAIIAWHDDLKLFWDGNWSLENTSMLIKKSTKQKLFSILRKSAIIGFISYAIVILSYLFIPFEIFRIGFIIFVVFVVIFPFFIYLKEKKYFDLPKRYKDIRLSAYQNLVSSFFILPMSSSWIFRFVLESNDGFLDVSLAEGIFVNFLLLFFFSFEAAIIVSQLKYLEIIKKIIPYLQENFKVSN
ncbi:hypothetical protein [Chryseobacterium indoltheticum]|uniref:hypothetical protein n=1 Tax=Chryseobacterium indoltheticum TaxID=254 RepID=UPI003F494F25